MVLSIHYSLHKNEVGGVTIGQAEAEAAALMALAGPVVGMAYGVGEDEEEDALEDKLLIDERNIVVENNNHPFRDSERTLFDDALAGRIVVVRVTVVGFDKTRKEVEAIDYNHYVLETPKVERIERTSTLAHIDLQNATQKNYASRFSSCTT